MRSAEAATRAFGCLHTSEHLHREWVLEPGGEVPANKVVKNACLKNSSDGTRNGHGWQRPWNQRPVPTAEIAQSVPMRSHVSDCGHTSMCSATNSSLAGRKHSLDAGCIETILSKRRRGCGAQASYWTTRKRCGSARTHRAMSNRAVPAGRTTTLPAAVVPCVFFLTLLFRVLRQISRASVD